MTAQPYEIYAITNDQYWYVGSASGKLPFAARRFDEHRRGIKSAAKLQAVIARDGFDSLSQIVLEAGVGDHIAAERRWYELGQLYETRECLNGGPPALAGSLPGCGKGRITPPAVRAKLSLARKGIPLGPQSPEHIAKLSAVRKGRPAANKGKPSPRRGIPQTTEWIAKRTGANIGSHRTAEQRDRIARSLRGRKLSPEARRNMSAVRMGTDAVRDNGRKGACRRWFINQGKSCICGSH